MGRREKPLVLYVVQAFGGGAFNVIRDATWEVASSGKVDIAIAATIGPDTPKDYATQLHPGIIFLELPMPTASISLGNAGSIMSALSTLKRIIEELNPDVLHLHSSVAGIIGRLAARIVHREQRPRVLYTPHGLSFLRTSDSAFKRSAYRFIETLGHLAGGEIVACGQSEKAAYTSGVLFGARRNSKVVPNGIYVPQERQRRVQINMPKVGTLGRITEQKSPQSFAKLARSNLNARFFWIGDGDPTLRHELEASGVNVLGWLGRDNALEVLGELDVYVHYSAWEGLSIALLEAMGMGLPTVVSDLPANMDVVSHEATGLVARSESELVTHVNLLLTDEELRNRLGIAARNLVSTNYSVKRMAQDLIDIYLEQ